MITPTPETIDVEALLAKLASEHEASVDEAHRYWCPCAPLRPFNGYRAHRAHVAAVLAAALAPWVAQQRAEVAERIALAMESESEKAAVRELADPNAYARRCAYDRAARIARADRIAPTTEEQVHEFTEDVNDGSMCVCGIPALTHDEWEERR